MKTIKCTLQTLDRAISELERYQKSLAEKNHTLLEKLAEEGVDDSERRFQSAQYDGSRSVHSVLEWQNESTVYVTAVGQEVAFIEFGTGAKYPDIHPNATESWMEHGSWSLSVQGKGHWADKQGWWYPPSQHTFGNPANMCLYWTARNLERDVVKTAKEVFGK